MSHRSARQIALALMVFSLTVPPHAVNAQTTRPLEIGAGYQFLHQSVDRGGETFPAGVYGGLEQAVLRQGSMTLHWMAQFEAGFRTDSGFSEQLYTFLGGVRLSGVSAARWIPSGFGLLGLGVQNASCPDFCVGTSKGFALQGGAALSAKLKPSTLLDVTFKATKLTTTPGVFDAAVAAGIRISIGTP